MALLSWLFMKTHQITGASGQLLLNITRSMDLPIINTYLHTQETLLNSSMWSDPSTYTHIGTVLITLIVAAGLWNLIFSPLNRSKSMTDVGWDFMHPKNNNSWLNSFLPFTRSSKLSGRKLADQIKRLQQLRKAGKLPPVYPNGWFAIEESRNISKGQVVSVQALGENLAVFRGSSGEVMTIDAYCPHLGANLAAGGVVKGDCIQCPFHGWLFDGATGKCTDIPYVKKVPEVAKVKHWPTREVNGFIFIWYDAENREPQWEVPEVSEITSGYWRYRGRTQHEVLAHIQEIPENGADIAHLGHLHVPIVLKGSNLNAVFSDNKIMDSAIHHWDGVWKNLEGDEAHIAKVQIHHSLNVKPFGWKLLQMDVEAEQIGPGLVHLHFDTPLGKGVLVQTVTPLGPLRQNVYHHFYTAPTLVTPIAKIMLKSEANHFERDVTIWNSKQYLHRPVLVPEDKLIKKYRAWYSQFYSEHSPTMEAVNQSDMDW